jgi:hypothetical protein
MLESRGHQSNGSGLQNHSIGGIYPYIIGYKPYSKEYYLMFSSGDILQNYISYNDAYNAALVLLQHYEVYRVLFGNLNNFNAYLLEGESSNYLRRDLGLHCIK